MADLQKPHATGCAPVDRPPAPMEARLVGALPEGPGWQFEPKWDGFRAIAMRNGADVEIHSKSGKPLGRYFPEIVAALTAVKESCFILDGEIILPLDGALSFDALQARLHPAPSRIARLAKETPARLMLFDCLMAGKASLVREPLSDRRAALEAFHARHGGPSLLLSPCTHDAKRARAWLGRSGRALDGVMAKGCDDPYRPGERAMLKVKQIRTADCVVGGFREKAGEIVSLLLGLYDEAGALDLVGFLAGMSAAFRKELRDRLEPLAGGEGFTGKAPGGPSRWSAGADAAWAPLRPELVVEIAYDQVTGRRFRHGTRFVRWRPDKAPRQCTMEQLARPLALSGLLTSV